MIPARRNGRGRPRLRGTRAVTVRLPLTAAEGLLRFARDLRLAPASLAALALLEGLEALGGLPAVERAARARALAARWAAP